MSTTLAMVRLDLLTVRPYGKSSLAFLVVAAACAFALTDPSFAVTIGTVYAALMVSYPFAAADRNDLDTLYATLPLSRRAFLAGRYLFAVVLYALTTVVMSALTAAVGVVSGRPMSGDALVTLLAACTAIYATVVALQFPLFCWLGYARARLVALLPFVAVAPAAILVDRWHLTWTPPPPGAALPLAIGYGAVVLAASAAVAGRLRPRTTRPRLGAAVPVRRTA